MDTRYCRQVLPATPAFRPPAASLPRVCLDQRTAFPLPTLRAVSIGAEHSRCALHSCPQAAVWPATTESRGWWSVPWTARRAFGSPGCLQSPRRPTKVTLFAPIGGLRSCNQSACAVLRLCFAFCFLCCIPHLVLPAGMHAQVAPLHGLPVPPVSLCSELPRCLLVPPVVQASASLAWPATHCASAALWRTPSTPPRLIARPATA